MMIRTTNYFFRLSSPKQPVRAATAVSVIGSAGTLPVPETSERKYNQSPMSPGSRLPGAAA